MMYVKLNSPYLRDIKILKKGSGNIRSKIALWGKSMTRSMLNSPILNRKMKKRADDLKKKTILSKNTKISL